MSESDEVDGEQLRVRATSELLGRLDAEAQRMSTLVPGVRITRSDVVRAILTAGLDERERAAQAST